MTSSSRQQGRVAVGRVFAPVEVGCRRFLGNGAILEGARSAVGKTRTPNGHSIGLANEAAATRVTISGGVARAMSTGVVGAIRASGPIQLYVD
jgi:hypothetical protein